LQKGVKELFPGLGMQSGRGGYHTVKVENAGLKERSGYERLFVCHNG
jgi:hypothetical protein